MTSSPFRIQDFWSVATPGTTLCLLNGVYQGSADRVVPPSGLSGTKDKPITIRALNDGQVLIDGQHQRVPVSLPTGSSWFVLEGFNAARSSSTVISVRGSNNIFRRIVAWDAHIAKNADVWLLTESSAVNNLFEDVAGFGTGKNIFSFARMGSGNVCRRCWARWEGSTNYNFKRVINMAYGDAIGLARCENCISIWSAESMPHTYSLTDSAGVASYGEVFTNYEVQLPGALYWYGGGGAVLVNSKVLGSIGIVPASTPGNWAPTTYGLIDNKYKSGITVRHSLMFISPSHPAFSNQRGHRFEAGSNNIVANSTSVRGRSDSFLSGVTTSGFSSGTSIGAVANPWTATSTGANLCYRWVNGVVTTTPLWPWPMNSRIKAATAMAGAYSGPCPSCIGGRQVRTVTDVTAQVQALFGTIPQSCRTQ